jgi:hypothetical protein
MQIKVLKDISVPIATAVPLGGEGLKESCKLPLKGVLIFYASEDLSDSYVTDVIV